ncbi:ankyrin repeat domain-containing protein [Bacilliculturomica massiliensis]|uniref:ankyrin repeat domain-containing protein n=1 Tax=Bacilliculturomica massiliensis TaxID=1917867 RepID=UPI001031C62C|nr:ankyrin repeat domain-containing protein [Bacilliculturomica massiliensis]
MTSKHEGKREEDERENDKGLRIWMLMSRVEMLAQAGEFDEIVNEAEKTPLVLALQRRFYNPFYTGLLQAGLTGGHWQTGAGNWNTMGNSGNFTQLLWEQDRAAWKRAARILCSVPEVGCTIELSVDYRVGEMEYQMHGGLLGAAVIEGDAELVRLLLKSGFKPDGWEDGFYYVDFAGLILQRSYTMDRFSCSVPVGWTTRCVSADGVDQGWCGRTFTLKTGSPLMAAVTRGDQDCARLLLEAGASYDPDNLMCSLFIGNCPSAAMAADLSRTAAARKRRETLRRWISRFCKKSDRI